MVDDTEEVEENVPEDVVAAVEPEPEQPTPKQKAEHLKYYQIVVNELGSFAARSLLSGKTDLLISGSEDSFNIVREGDGLQWLHIFTSADAYRAANKHMNKELTIVPISLRNMLLAALRFGVEKHIDGLFIWDFVKEGVTPAVEIAAISPQARLFKKKRGFKGYLPKATKNKAKSRRKRKRKT